MKNFLSCDWGTSSFRLKLVEISTLQTLGEVVNNNGIATTFSAWKTNSNGKSRFLFYASVIGSAAAELGNKLNLPLSFVPVVISGMASSSLGMISIPYKKVPFKTDGSDLEVQWIKASQEFSHDVILISGACTETDVMRGEETQLVGAMQTQFTQQHNYIFPGTHSKHIHVKEDEVYDFKTYMTGEIFALLSTRSTLAEAVEKVDGLLDDSSVENFIEGVKESSTSNLLHSLFTVRTRFLLKNLPRTMNHAYLSGLLIGYEIQDLLNSKVNGITLVGGSVSKHYEIAFRALDLDVPVTVLNDSNVTVTGQWAVISNHPEISKLFKS